MAKSTRTTSSGENSRRFTRGSGQPADWEMVDPELIRAAISAASVASGAIRFGYTSDGGAYAVGIYGDGDKPYTEFVRPADDIEAFLRDIETLFLDIASENRPRAR